MIPKELIDKINYLSRKSRSVGLTPEEKEEQAQVRQEYLKGIRQQVINTLDQIKYAPEHPESCPCGCKSKSTH